jgi:hypothetical protein
MSKKYGYVIDPRGKRIEIETTYDPLDDEKFKSKKHRAPAEQHFARLTRERQKLLKGASGAAWAIYSYLLTVNWKNLHQPVKLTNAVLAGMGVLRDAKARALRQLERAGLIEVKRAGLSVVR